MVINVVAVTILQLHLLVGTAAAVDDGGGDGDGDGVDDTAGFPATGVVEVGGVL